MDDSYVAPPNVINKTSTRLLRDLRTDQGEAWRELVYLYGPVLRYWISRSGVTGKADIADIIQDVFLAVRANIGNFQREDGQAKFRAWLKTVTRSKVMDHFRSRGKSPEAVGGSTAQAQIMDVPEEAEPETQDSQAYESEQTILVRRAMEMVQGEFQESTWKAFYRTSVDGLSATEVASELGMSSAAVRKNKSRVLNRIRQVLEEAGA